MELSCLCAHSYSVFLHDRSVISVRGASYNGYPQGRGPITVKSVPISAKLLQKSRISTQMRRYRLKLLQKSSIGGTIDPYIEKRYEVAPNRMSAYSIPRRCPHFL